MIEHLDCGSVQVWLCPVEAAPTRREAEQRAVGRLLRAAFPDGAELRHTAEGVPCLAGSDVYISISHSRTCAALAVCADAPVGIDVEDWREQLTRVAPRVLSAAELAVYGASPELLLRAWTLKEALYKAAGIPGADFRRDIHLPLLPDATSATVGRTSFTIITPRTGLALAIRK